MFTKYSIKRILSWVFIRFCSYLLFSTVYTLIKILDSSLTLSSSILILILYRPFKFPLILFSQVQPFFLLQTILDIVINYILLKQHSLNFLAENPLMNSPWFPNNVQSIYFSIQGSSKFFTHQFSNGIFYTSFT